MWFDLQLTVESFKDGGRSKSAAGTTEIEGTRMQKERKVSKKPVLLHAEVQTMVFGQTKDLEVLETISVLLQDYTMHS